MTRQHRAVACVVAALAVGSALNLRAQRASAPIGSAALAVVVSTDEGTLRPLRRVSVSLQANELGVPRTAVTGDDGRAVFDGLPAGNFLVSAARPGYVRTFHGSRVPGSGPGVAVALVDGQRLEIRLHVLRGGVISGVVRTPSGRPAANLNVQALDRRRSRSGQQQSLFYDPAAAGALTDDRGAYRIYGLPPGEYVVMARSPVRDDVRLVTAAELQWADRIAAGSSNPGAAPSGYSSAPAAAPSAAFAPVYYPGTAVVADATPIRVEAGEERLGVDFALHLVPTAQLRGRLIDAEGRPQPNQSITARLAQPGGSDVLQMIEAAFGVSARTGADGSFTMNGVRPGRYVVEARATPRTADEGAPPPAPGIGRTGTHWVKQEIAVAGADITDLTLVLRPGLTISGRVVYDGTLAPPTGPIAQAFRLIPADADPITGMAMSIITESRVSVAADGTFSVAGVAPGQYRVVTQNAFIASVAPNAVASAGGWVLKSAMARDRDVADAPLEVRAGEDVSGVVVTFTDRPTSITGQVFDQAGRVTANFPIVIFSTDRAAWVPSSRRIRLVRPATDGRFAALGLPPGEYHVAAVTAVEPDQLADKAFLEQLAAMSIRLVLADGEQKTQDLKLGGG